jgi:hypothetical protein
MKNKVVSFGWLAAIVGLHLGIALFLGLYTFAAVMIVLSVAAFGFNGNPLTVSPFAS